MAICSRVSLEQQYVWSSNPIHHEHLEVKGSQLPVTPLSQPLPDVEEGSFYPSDSSEVLLRRGVWE